jgi:hypothetical protein
MGHRAGQSTWKTGEASTMSHQDCSIEIPKKTPGGDNVPAKVGTSVRALFAP